MWYAIYRLYKRSLLKDKKILNLEDVSHDVDLLDPSKKQRDCNAEVHSCVTANDCTQICDAKNGQYMCNVEKFLCEPMELNVTPATTVLPLNCDPKKGFLNTISVSELFGVQVSCVNTLPAYYQENGDLWPHVCSGGQFNPDPDRGYGQYLKCKCPPDHTLALKSTHPGPRCIPNDAIPFLPSFSAVQ